MYVHVQLPQNLIAVSQGAQVAMQPLAHLHLTATTAYGHWRYDIGGLTEDIGDSWKRSQTWLGTSGGASSVAANWERWDSNAAVWRSIRLLCRSGHDFPQTKQFEQH